LPINYITCYIVFGSALSPLLFIMNEPLFPRTGKQVVPLTSFDDDDEATLVCARPNGNIERGTARNGRRMVRLTAHLVLLLLGVFLTHLLERRLISHHEPTEPQLVGKYEILPASLVKADPFPEYTISLVKGEWVDTRIVIRADQEVLIEYAEESALAPWTVKTDAGDESTCPDDCRIVSNRWDAEGHNEPIKTDYLLGDLHQDTLKMALYWKNDEPITLNIIVRGNNQGP
jgi:hypothetical protein